MINNVWVKIGLEIGSNHLLSLAKIQSGINATRKPTTEKMKVVYLNIRIYTIKTKETQDAYEDKYSKYQKKIKPTIQRWKQKKY